MINRANIYKRGKKAKELGRLFFCIKGNSEIEQEFWHFFVHKIRKILFLSKLNALILLPSCAWHTKSGQSTTNKAYWDGWEFWPAHIYQANVIRALKWFKTTLIPYYLAFIVRFFVSDETCLLPVVSICLCFQLESVCSHSLAMAHLSCAHDRSSSLLHLQVCFVGEVAIARKPLDKYQ